MENGPLDDVGLLQIAERKEKKEKETTQNIRDT